jgi:hypothetical protein
MFSLGLSIPMSPAVRTARFICYAGAAAYLLAGKQALAMTPLRPIQSMSTGMEGPVVFLTSSPNETGHEDAAADV